jgi:hypothetical protein
MGWYLDLGMGDVPVVKPGPGQKPNLSRAELRAQRWPDCPVCGDPVHVESVPTEDAGSWRVAYIPERAWCPRDAETALVAALVKRQHRGPGS